MWKNVRMRKWWLPFFPSCDISVLWALLHKVRNIWPLLMHWLCVSSKNEARERNTHWRVSWALLCEVWCPEEPSMDITCWILCVIIIGNKFVFLMPFMSKRTHESSYKKSLILWTRTWWKIILIALQRSAIGLLSL